MKGRVHTCGTGSPLGVNCDGLAVPVGQPQHLRGRKATWQGASMRATGGMLWQPELHLEQRESYQLRKLQALPAPAVYQCSEQH